MGIVDHGRGGTHTHTLVDRGTAGGLEFRHFFDFDQAHAAVGIRFELWMVAKMGNHDADTPSGFDHQGAFRNLDGHSIDRYANHRGCGLRHS